jgi:hypothetical protein
MSSIESERDIDEAGIQMDVDDSSSEEDELERGNSLEQAQLKPMSQSVLPPALDSDSDDIPSVEEMDVQADSDYTDSEKEEEEEP